MKVSLRRLKKTDAPLMLENAFIEKKIDDYRLKTIDGKCIRLRPITQSVASDVVALRNREKNRYYLNQTYELTLDAQNEWYEKYLERHDDIYWGIYTLEDDFLGTIRVYNIDAENDICEMGSFMIAQERANEAPYAVEAMVLSIDFVFDILNIKQIINENRTDNKVMNNLSRKIGFEYKKSVVINHVDYNYYILTREAYLSKREKFSSVVEYWVTR